MATFFQPVVLPERCLLSEVLYWVAFQRLPIFETDHDGVDIRESAEAGGYVIEVGNSFLDENECARANIPADPKYLAFINDTTTLSVSYYDGMLEKSSDDDDPDFRRHLEEGREEARKFESDCKVWETHYLGAIEYPASRIFVALKGGQLVATGRLLPTLDRNEAKNIDRDIFEIEFTEIPRDFWSFKGIDFEASAARNSEAHYCHISLRTDDVLSKFPGERSSVGDVQRIGDTLVVADATKNPLAKSKRGRPSYPWEPFHHEVASLLRSNALPDKKEAAIQYFQSWFFKEHGIHPSRAAIGEKLTPYYEKFVRRGGQKI
jgi:hypothetical protein